MDFDTEYETESWEAGYELYEEENWTELVKLRKIEAKNNPSDLYAQQRYAEALNLNKKFNETLDFITPLYEMNYNEEFGISEIIDALYGLGKTENDFKWIEKPIILKLDSNTTQTCIDVLKDRKKPVSITDLYCDLLLKGINCRFDEYEFAGFLIQQTNEFDIQLNNDYIISSKIEIKKR